MMYIYVRILAMEIMKVRKMLNYLYLENISGMLCYKYKCVSNNFIKNSISFSIKSSRCEAKGIIRDTSKHIRYFIS